MENYRSLPFAMYDLAVYLPGGAVLLVVTRYVIESLTGLSLGAGLLPATSDSISLVVRGIVWISASYLAGHIGAFASTYLIEKFVHNSLGFPSDIWLENEQTTGSGDRSAILRKIFTNRIKNSDSSLVSYIILLSQIPAWMPLIIFRIVKPFGFYSPKIPLKLLDAVEKRFALLELEVKVEKGSRWEKIVEHFVANHCPLVYTRMYNYLVIYGALRLISLIILIICWYMMLHDFQNKMHYGFKFGYIETLSFFTATFVYIISVMAFAKFNRRYFEETILAFLLAPNGLMEPRVGPRVSSP